MGDAELSGLGQELSARTDDVVARMMKLSAASSRTLDKVVEDSFEDVGTVSTVAVARWMAGEGEAVAREVGQESWRIFAQLASQRGAGLNEVTKNSPRPRARPRRESPPRGRPRRAGPPRGRRAGGPPPPGPGAGTPGRRGGGWSSAASTSPWCGCASPLRT